MQQCVHLEFEATVNVYRITDKEAFTAEIRISCRDCGAPFEFVGVAGGSSPSEPRVSFDRHELRAPIVPPNGRVPIGMAGFDIKVNGLES